MEPLSAFLTTALGYILKSAAQSGIAKTAKEELLGGFWRWLRPKFIKDLPETLATETKAHERLLELIQDEGFFNELVKRVAKLQEAGIKEKNTAKSNRKNIQCTEDSIFEVKKQPLISRKLTRRKSTQTTVAAK